MRGKHNFNLCYCLILRITPAHAGKTQSSTRIAKNTADHPRACGENRLRMHRKRRAFGSPPRMRGKRIITDTALRAWRITPAHAGKTFISLFYHSSKTDHPRACGENLCGNSGNSSTNGSPPRMRGKRFIPLFLQLLERITPAHAGKTLRKWRISVVDPSPQPQSSLTSRKADASSGSQRAPCAAPV